MTAMTIDLLAEFGERLSKVPATEYQHGRWDCCAASYVAQWFSHMGVQVHQRTRQTMFEAELGYDALANFFGIQLEDAEWVFSETAYAVFPVSPLQVAYRIDAVVREYRQADPTLSQLVAVHEFQDAVT